MSVYERLAGRADSLIRRYGAEAVLIRPPAPAQNERWDAAGALPTRISCWAVRTEFRASDVDGTQVRRGDVRLVVEALSAEPLLGDVFEFADERFAVVPPVRKISPAGEPVVYIVQGRA